MGKEEYSMVSALGNTSTYNKSPHNGMGNVSLSSFLSHICITLFNNQSCIPHHQLLRNTLNFLNCIRLWSLKKRRSRQARPWRLEWQIVSRYLTTLCCGSFLWVEIIAQRSLWKSIISFGGSEWYLSFLFFYQRGPRYFDPQDSGWRTCYNCGEGGHTTANCSSAKRKKPCFVCGSFEHHAKQCQKVCGLKKVMEGLFFSYWLINHNYLTV